MAPKNQSANDRYLESKMRAARARLCFLRPYFTHALLSLILRRNGAVPTLAVDRWRRLYWSPRYVQDHSVDELASALKHELTHVLREHHQRAEAFGITSATSAAANVAMDAEINDDHRDEIEAVAMAAQARRHAGEVNKNEPVHLLPHLPGDVIYPATIGCPDGWVWERYYQSVLDSAMKCVSLGEGMPSDDGGLGGSASGRDGDGGRSTITFADCGSGAHGCKRVWEDASPAAGAEGVSDADWQNIKRHTAREIAERDRTRGDVPGEWVSWAGTILRPPPIPWDQELQAPIRSAITQVSGMVVYNYQRPSRRQSLSRDFILPSWRRPLPFVCIVMDTSGSMGDEVELAAVRGVVTDIAQAAGAYVACLATDAQVHGGAQFVHIGDDLLLAGRGGTDMRVGIAYAVEELEPRPDIVVVISDCETPWPELDIGVPLIVAAIVDSKDDELLGEVPRWAVTIPILRSELLRR